MAQYNNVHLYALACSDARADRDSGTGDIVNASVFAYTISSARRYEGANEGNKIELNQILIRSGVPEMAAKIAEIRLHDIFILKGTLNTRNVPKYVTCPQCSLKYNAVSGTTSDDALGMTTFVTPIDLYIRDRSFGDRTREIKNMDCTKDEITKMLLDERNKAFQMLLEHREMSNEVQVIGTLCADPEQYENGWATAYQVGINRNFYLRDDSPSSFSDYPFIRSYGRQADSDMEHLQKGTLVLVDGFLRIRTFDRITKCPECGTEKQWESRVLEIVPYSVQYLDGVRHKDMDRETERSGL